METIGKYFPLAYDWSAKFLGEVIADAGVALLIGLAVIAIAALFVLVLNIITFVDILRRKEWPEGHNRWTWVALAVAGIAVAIFLPGPSIFIATFVPIAYLLLIKRKMDS